MVKLTADLIWKCPHFFNALKERELDLRGNKIAVIENLAATELDNFPYLKRLGTLLINKNRVTRINPNIGGRLLCCSHFPFLQSSCQVYIRCQMPYDGCLLVIHPPPAFGSSPNLEALALEANKSNDQDGDSSLIDSSHLSRTALTDKAKYFVEEVKGKSGKDIDISSWEQEFVEDLLAQENGILVSSLVLNSTMACIVLVLILPKFQATGMVHSMAITEDGALFYWVSSDPHLRCQQLYSLCEKTIVSISAGKYWAATATAIGDVYMLDGKKSMDKPPVATRLHRVKGKKIP
ncbi:hypothetical protein GOBAR_DD07184 [Gossypium barbadense]|nr:hypothetical protein GOBAR_DD07184 [Gossypium barbadense]